MKNYYSVYKWCTVKCILNLENKSNALNELILKTCSLQPGGRSRKKEKKRKKKDAIYVRDTMKDNQKELCALLEESWQNW